MDHTPSSSLGHQTIHLPAAARAFSSPKHRANTATQSNLRGLRSTQAAGLLSTCHWPHRDSITSCAPALALRTADDRLSSCISRNPTLPFFDPTSEVSQCFGNGANGHAFTPCSCSTDLESPLHWARSAIQTAASAKPASASNNPDIALKYLVQQTGNALARLQRTHRCGAVIESLRLARVTPSLLTWQSAALAATMISAIKRFFNRRAGRLLAHPRRRAPCPHS